MAVGDRQTYFGCLVNHNTPPSPLFSQVLILKVVKVLCFDTLLQVLILKVVAVSVFLQPFAKCGPFEARKRAPIGRVVVPGIVAGRSWDTPTPGVLEKEAASC